MRKRKNILNNSKGQAVLEFFLFLPLFLILFLVMITISGSINGSINQQKATRGYYYYITKGNAKIPPPRDLDTLFNNGGIKLSGMHVFGWMDHRVDKKAVAPCYKLESLVGSVADDECEDISKIDNSAPRSKFIRVYTVYGICTAGLYQIDGPSKFSDISSGAWTANYCRTE